jgi:hypothetical protein
MWLDLLSEFLLRLGALFILLGGWVWIVNPIRE